MRGPSAFRPGARQGRGTVAERSAHVTWTSLAAMRLASLHFGGVDGARQALLTSVAEALRAAHPAGGHQAATFSGTASNGTIRASLSSLYVPTILHVPSSSRWTVSTRDSRSTTHA